MNKTVAPWLLGIFGFLAWHAGSIAGEPNGAATKTTDRQPPTTLRMWHVGNSWSVPFPFEMVGLDRPFVHHTHNFGRQGKNWVEESLEKDKKNVLVNGDFDVVYLGFVQLSLPVEALDQMTTLALKYKPDCRIYLQHAWASGGGYWAPGDRSSIGTLRDDDDLAAIQVEWDKRRKKLEDKVDEINKQHGKQVVFIIPLADAVMKMRQMVAAGKLPGVTKQSQLFADDDELKRRDDHAGKQIAVLAVYCAYAAIHRKSPEGLKLSSPDGFFGGPRADKGKVPVDDAQHAILQKLAWETVSKYPYAGIAK
jgi:hypothetical protein